MSEEKWTPGAWVPARSVKKIKIAETYTTDDVCTKSGRAVCTMTGDCARAFHDVNLIAAAPDLYAALSAVEWVEEVEDGGWFFCPRCLRYKQVGHAKNCPLNAALKKARGES